MQPGHEALVTFSSHAVGDGLCHWLLQKLQCVLASKQVPEWS